MDDAQAATNKPFPPSDGEGEREKIERSESFMALLFKRKVAIKY